MFGCVSEVGFSAYSCGYSRSLETLSRKPLDQPQESSWYLYPHDEVLCELLAQTRVGQTKSWREKRGYSFPGLSDTIRSILEPYRIPEVDEQAEGTRDEDKGSPD